MQLDLLSIKMQSERDMWRKADAYARKHRTKYLAYARKITPRYDVEEDIYARVAFAILSANAPFEETCKAFVYCYSTKWKPDPEALVEFMMVPAKADYVREMAERPFRLYLRGDSDWDTYRLRLREIRGLGLAKATFAACLLYPLEADLACVDTWIQKVFLGHSGFKTLGHKAYCVVENEIRKHAKRWRVPTFVAQWLLWDCVRGTGPNSHGVLFPGAHKTQVED